MLPNKDRVGQRFAILGAGISGAAALRLVQALGGQAQLFDEKVAADVAFFERADVAHFDAFILSPGFAASHAWRILAESSGKPCYGELGFAAQYWQGLIYAVTGTNGKTTITNLLTEALQVSGSVAVAAGNIGLPLSDAVRSAANQAGSVLVCEVSSFQAELPLGLKLDALLWSNFAEDHLDRYGSMSAYFKAKAQLLACLKHDGLWLIAQSLSPWIEEFIAHTNVSVLPHDCGSCRLQLAADSNYRNAPNDENLDLVARFWRALGAPMDALQCAANSGQIAAHRLNLEASLGGVSFWNDSKATNFHAVWAAFESLSGPIFWIGGGRGKGGDLTHFAQSVLQRVEAVFLYGEVAEQFAQHLYNDSVRVQQYTSLESAVRAAAAAAAELPLAHVLLSPGFSSLDQFNSYAERGKCFISTVLSLMPAVSSD